MKKHIAMLLSAVLCLTALTGCGKTEAKPTATVAAVEGETEQIIERIYANHADIELPLLTMNLDLADDNTLQYNTGLTAETLSQVSVSEPMMGQPYSLVVVRLKDAKDSEQTAKTMLQNVDTRKWICVQADTETAGYVADVAFFFMVSSGFADLVTVETMQKAIETACPGVTWVSK